MSKSKYSYNLKSVRYERAGVRWGSVVFGGVTLLVFGVLFFLGLVYIQNRLFESTEEARLKHENLTLAKHKELIEAELGNKEVQLASLYERESELHKKVFLTDKPVEVVKPDKSAEILNYELSDFESLTAKLIKKTSSGMAKAKIQNYQYSKLFWPGKDDVSELQSYPTISPVKDFDFKNLASGFGNQINPFNKRMYHHNGIDIICERGTEVLAAGKGTVLVARYDETPGGKGSYVVIEHANGYQSRYAHLSQVNVVYGQKISQGQVIGAVGTTGSAIAPHLHYEILKKGSVINPILFFVEDLSESELSQLAKLNNQVKQSLD